MEIPTDWSYCQTLKLNCESGVLRSELCLTSIPLSELKPYAKTFLHPHEFAYFSTLKFERRQLSYLLGHFAAKQAIIRYGIQATFTHILIDYGVFQFPLVNLPNKEKIQISYSHSNQFCVALCFPDNHPMGIDLEVIDPDKNSVVETQLTPDEKKLKNALSAHSSERLNTLFWTVKEALSKTLRTGLTTPFEVFAIKSIKFENNYWLSEFKNFAQYHALSFSLDGFICSIVYPKQTQMEIDIPAIQCWLTKQHTL